MKKVLKLLLILLVIGLVGCGIYGAMLYQETYHGTATKEEIASFDLLWSYGLDYQHDFEFEISELDEPLQEEFVTILNESCSQNFFAFLLGHFEYESELYYTTMPWVMDGGGSFEGTIILTNGTTLKLDPYQSYDYRTWLDQHAELLGAYAGD